MTRWYPELTCEKCCRVKAQSLKQNDMIHVQNESKHDEVSLATANSKLFVLTILVTILITFIMNCALYRYHQNRNRHDRYGTSVLHSTKEGRSYPILGHAITFLLYPPWDLLTLWHQRKLPRDDTVKSASSSSTSEQQQQQQQSQQPTQQNPIVCFPLMGNMMYSIASPYYCKCILQSKIVHVQKDVYNTMKPFLSILGTGIVSSEGQHWLQQRLKMSHPLRHDILSIIPIQTVQAVQRLFRILDDACRLEVQVPIGTLLRHLTLQVISSSFLSLSHDESDETFAKLYLPIVEECNQRVWHPYRSYMPILPSFYRYHTNVYRLNAYVSSLIRKRWTLRCNERHQKQTNHRRIDILDKILQVYETNNIDHAHDAVSITTTTSPTTMKMLPESIVRQVRDELKTFMLAGHETSAALMTWTMYELLLSCESRTSTYTTTTDNNNSNNNSENSLLEKVCSEANHVFDPAINWLNASESDLPTTEKLSQLMLIEACLKESLRKYSVVPIAARRVVQDLYLEKDHTSTNGATPYYLPKGSTVLINIQAVHLDPALWPNPMIYNPYRFVQEQTIHDSTSNGNSDGTSKEHTTLTSALSWKEIDPYTFLPFIAGPRNCLGQHLALLETKMVIALLFQRYHFSFTKEHQAEASAKNPCMTDKNNATSWRDSSILDPRHRYMVPIIPKSEIMLRVSQKKIQS
jgi:cytochrome P450